MDLSRTGGVARIVSGTPGTLERGVRGMLPKNRLGRKQLRKLKVYAGSDHAHAAQSPEPLQVA